MRFAPVAAVILGLAVLIIFGQPMRTRAAEDRSISGTVFFDTDRDGLRGANELPAPGRTVQLSRFDRVWREVDQVKSDAEGRYHFDHVPFNVSSLNVGVRTDEQTECITGTMQGIGIQNGQMLMGTSVSPGARKDLGVLPMGNGSITGTLTNDLNENGIHDAGEPSLKGWKLTISGYDSSPPTACYSEVRTGPDGAFQFAVNLEHPYMLGVNPPSSVSAPWEWTAPTLAPMNPDFPGQRRATEGVAKGSRLEAMVHLSTGSASLSGTAFRDLDGDGVHDVTEPFLDCAMIKAGVLQLSREVPDVGAIEVHSTPTCINGDFKFNRLEGGDYHIGIPAYLSLTEWYRPWTGRWVTVLGGRHAKGFVIALCPDSVCPQPSATATPPVPVERRSPEVPIVMPAVGSGSDQSNPVSTPALLIAMTGLASIFIAVLLYAHRPRRACFQNGRISGSESAGVEQLADPPVPHLP